MIDVSHDLPASPAKCRDDRNDAAGPSLVQGRMRRRGEPDAALPGDAALVRLVRLLARQAAQEHFISRGVMT